MNPRFRVLVWMALAMACAVSQAETPAKKAEEHVYLVVFGMTFGADSRRENVRVATILEPLSKTRNAVQVELPPAFIAIVKKELDSAGLQPQFVNGKQVETLAVFAYSPGEHGTRTPVSLGVLNGAMGSIVNLDFGGQASIFGKNLGKSAILFTYYAVPKVREGREQRKAVIEAEIKRCAANVGGEVITRKDTELDDQLITEVTAKSPKNKALTIRFRVICSPQQMLAITASASDNQDADEQKAFAQIFEGFRFK